MDSLAHVKLSDLMTRAAESKVPFNRFKVKTVFPELGERNSDRGGGALDAGDRLLLERVITDPTLAEVIKLGEQVAGTTHRKLQDLILSLLEVDDEAVLCVLSPPTLQ